MDHDVNAEDGVVAARKVLQVRGREAYPLRVSPQLGLKNKIHFVSEDS